MPTPLCDAEGNTAQGAIRKSCNGPVRSEILRMSGSLLPRSWEVSSVPASKGVGGAGKAYRHNPLPRPCKCGLSGETIGEQDYECKATARKRA